MTSDVSGKILDWHLPLSQRPVRLIASGTEFKRPTSQLGKGCLQWLERDSIQWRWLDGFEFFDMQSKVLWKLIFDFHGSSAQNNFAFCNGFVRETLMAPVLSEVAQHP